MVTSYQVALLSGQQQPYPGASLALDFIGSRTNGQQYYLLNGVATSAFASVPGLSVTRASVGYAQDVGGNLILFPSGVARITNQGLLVEEARTNIALQSQTLTNATWSKNGTTAATAATTAPDGTATGNSLTVSSSGSGQRFAFQAVAFSTGANNAISVYAKVSTTRYVWITFQGAANNWITAVFDLQGGTSAATQTGTGVTSGTIASTSMAAVAGGWMRLTITGSITGTSGFICMGIAGGATAQTLDTNGQLTFTAAGTEAIFLWAAQVEAGAFPTSYIPTAAATATRAADAVMISGLTVSNTAITLIGKGLSGPTGSTQTVVDLNDGTTNNRLSLLRTLTPTGTVQEVVAGSSVYQQASATWSPSTVGAIGISAIAGTQLGAFNQTALTPGVSASQITGANQLWLGSLANSTSYFNGSIQKVLVYPTAFSQAALNPATT